MAKLALILVLIIISVLPLVSGLYGPIDMKEGANITLHNGTIIGYSGGSGSSDLSGVLNKSGGTLLSNLAANGHKVTGLSSGTVKGDSYTFNQSWDKLNKTGELINFGVPVATVEHDATNVWSTWNNGTIIYPKAARATYDSACIDYTVDTVKNGTLRIKGSYYPYEITSTISGNEANRGLKIVGDGILSDSHTGYGTCLKVMNALPNGVFNFSSYSGGNAQIAFKGFSIIGNDRAYEVDGIVLYYGWRCQVEDVDVRDLKGIAISVNKFDYTFVNQCAVSECGQTSRLKPSIKVNSSAVDPNNFFKITNSNIDTGEYEWIDVSRTYDTEISGNYLEETTSPGVIYGIRCTTGRIHNNFIFSAPSAYAINAEDATDLFINDNEFTAPGVSGNNSTGAIYLHNSNAITINGNRVRWIGGNFVYSDISAPSSYVLIQGNQVFAYDKMDTAHAVYAPGIYYSQITGNIFRNFRVGVFSWSSDIIAYNQILACTQGIHIAPDTYGGTYTGNMFTDCGTKIYGTGASAPVIFRNIDYITETSGGTLSGTGSQQTIAHGLSISPSTGNIILTAGSATSNPYLSASPNSTHIFVTAENSQSYSWAIK